MIQFQSLSPNSREAAQLQLKGLQKNLPPSSWSCDPAKVINYRLQPEVKEPSFEYKITQGLGKGGFLCEHPCVQRQPEHFAHLLKREGEKQKKRKKWRKTQRARESCWGSISKDVILSEHGVKRPSKVQNWGSNYPKFQLLKKNPTTNLRWYADIFQRIAIYIAAVLQCLHALNRSGTFSAPCLPGTALGRSKQVKLENHPSNSWKTTKASNSGWPQACPIRLSWSHLCEMILHSQPSNHKAVSQTPRFSSKLKPSLILIQALTRPGARRPRSTHSRKPFDAGARWGI